MLRWLVTIGTAGFKACRGTLRGGFIDVDGGFIAVDGGFIAVGDDLTTVAGGFKADCCGFGMFSLGFVKLCGGFMVPFCGLSESFVRFTTFSRGEEACRRNEGCELFRGICSFKKNMTFPPPSLFLKIIFSPQGQ